MIDSSAPAQAEPEPQAEPPVQVEPEPQAQAAPVDDDAALDELESNALEIPTGEKLVPLSAVTSLREKLKTAKEGSKEAATLRQQLDQATAQLQAVTPLAQAFQAIQQAQQHAPQQPVQHAAPVEDMAELEEVAKDFDFYKADGTLDLDRSRRHQARVQKAATKIAQEQTAPLVQNTLISRVQANVERAKATVHPRMKTGADPAVIDGLVAQVLKQPGGLATLADPEAMKQIWLNAWSLSSFKEDAAAPVQQSQTPPQALAAPPLITERSGGRNVQQAPALSASEKRAAKDAGMTEKQYMDIASKMPW